MDSARERLHQHSLQHLDQINTTNVQNLKLAFTVAYRNGFVEMAYSAD